MAEREIVTRYFHLGYPNEVIRQFLSNYHDIVMSLRTGLKRRLSGFGLRRNMIDHENIERRIREVIENEISNGSGASLGYRSMWHLLRLQYHIHVPRGVVARILQEVDPEGVEQRRRRRLSRRRYISFGPNFCWHVDGECNNREILTVGNPPPCRSSITVKTIWRRKQMPIKFVLS